MRKTIALIVTAVFLLQGCYSTSTPMPVKRIEFPAAEYEELSKTGTGVVKGQAFMKTRGGDVKTAAGNEVTLNPVTSYSDQWNDVTYLGGRGLTQCDPQLDDYIITTIADADGRFHFKNVPPGEYYLTTSVIWEAPVGYQGALIGQGGLISKKMKVENDKTVEVILTR